MTPKRTMGQCQCSFRDAPDVNKGHTADCPALYPLQRQPGDEKDALTRLVAKLRTWLPTPERVLGECLNLISEAREEHKTALREVGQLITALEAEKAQIRNALLDTQKRMGEVRQQALQEGREAGVLAAAEVAHEEGANAVALCIADLLPSSPGEE